MKLFEQKALLLIKNKARHDGAGLANYINRNIIYK